MAVKRKLFLTHAGELAHLVLRTVGRGGAVTGFVHSYAERHDRGTLLGNPAQLAEVESTIAREALLVMAAEVRRLVPRVFASMAQNSLRAEQLALSQAFASEFLASLDRAMTAPTGEAPGEAETFQRDLEMYDRWTTRRLPGNVIAKTSDAARSPFPDRCALLLDPSMMGEARQAASEFEIELTGLAKKLLEHLGRQRAPAAAAARRARKSVRRSKKPARPSKRPAQRGKKRLRVRKSRPVRRQRRLGKR
jgi:hypothetical protein